MTPDKSDDQRTPAAERRPRDQRAALPAYEITGPAGAPVVVALGGISAHRHVTANEIDPTPGWWQDVVGRARAIDTEQFRVLSFDWLDGGADARGRPARAVTTHDQGDALAAVLDALGIDRVHAAVGASYGGMVVLAFAERHPDRVARIVVISAAHEPHPMSTGIRAIQRRIVHLGLDTGRAHDAVALARALGMTTYRSPREFADRFDTRPLSQTGGDATFPVESYLLHHGERFAARFRPERFLALSLSVDLHRVDPRRVRVPALLVAAVDDTLVPCEQMETLAAELAAPNELVRAATNTGHDAFLTEPEKIGPVVQRALTESTRP